MAAKKATTKEKFSAEEKAAMKERAKELKASANREEGVKALLDRIAELPEGERKLAKRVHEIITAAAPSLVPKTWYGMPAYANKDGKDGKIVCFFQSAAKFDTRYATLGFNDVAHLDDGSMWPTAYALIDLSAAEEAKITALIKKAVG